MVVRGLSQSTSYYYRTVILTLHPNAMNLRKLSFEFVLLASLLVSLVGHVKEVKIDARGPATQCIAKVKVKVDKLDALVVGTVVTYKGQKIWLDFTYEKLPHFYYSCGELDHYAKHCYEIPYVEENFTSGLGIVLAVS